MAIQLSDNLKINVGAPIDSKYLNGFNAPYANVLEVNTTIPIAQRYVGLTVNILNSEYWYENGVADIDLVTKGAGGGSGSGERIEKTVTQTSHGFNIGEVVTYSGGTYIKAIGDGTQGGEVIGFISEVTTVNEFVIVYAGYVDGASISGLVLNPSTTYYLSTSVAGSLQSTNPTVFGHISKPILVTFDASSALVYQYRGFVISSGASSGGATSGITDMANVGSGTGEIFSGITTGISGETAQIRTLLGSGSTNITTSGDTIIIDSSTNIDYTLESPSNIEVGGVPVGTTLTGKTLEEIIKEMLITVFFPILSNPNNIFTDLSANTQEVGVVTDLDFNTLFDRGLISPAYGTSGFRSGLPNTYNYTGTGLPASVASSATTNAQGITGYTILTGTQSWTNTVDYDAGEQPKDSEGNNYSTPLPSGTTGVKSLSINGIYPWFYGKVSSGGAAAGINRPTANQALITGGTKLVATSTGTIIVPDFTSTSDDYIWFAVPTPASPLNEKTVWYVNALNNGSIGGTIPSGNLFPDFDTVVNIDSPSGLWTNVSYDIYISEVQTAASIMEFRNS